MTAKQFFKSTGFRSVIVLLCIALISAFLLTVLHYLWPAADVTMDMNIVSEMYDNKSASFTAVELVEGSTENSDYGNVIGVVSADDGGYVILAHGTGGYGNSGVGMYVAIREGAIVSVAIGDKGGETYWDRVEGSDLLANYKGKEISQEIPLTADINLPAGNAGASAPMTSEAIWRAVNMAAWYAREVLKLGENIDAKSQEAIKALEGYQNSVLQTVQASNYDSVALAVEGATFMMLYTVDGSKEAYVYKVGDVYCAYIVDGTTRQVLAKTAGVDSTVDTAITTLIAGFNTYGATVSNAAVIVNGTSYVYELTAKSVSNGMPNDYRLRITVTDGTIADFEVLVDGATEGYGNNTIWNGNDAVFDGKDEAGLDGINISTGATNSNKTVINALKYCLKDYAIHQATGTTSAVDVASYYDVEDATLTFATLSNYSNSYGTYVWGVTASDGGYMFMSVGNGSFGGKGVKVVTIVREAKIAKLTVVSYEGESFWGDIVEPSKIYEKYVGLSVSAPIALTPDLTATGATYSSISLNNAVNVAVYAYGDLTK